MLSARNVTALQQTAVRLFDHLVGAQKERPRDCQPERFRDLEIDDQFELGRLQHRQVSGIGRFENAPDI
jgi:hypothetical protein